MTGWRSPGWWSGLSWAPPPPASVLTGWLQLSDSLKQRSSELPDECEALVNLQGRMKGQYFRWKISDVKQICAEQRFLCSGGDGLHHAFLKQSD